MGGAIVTLPFVCCFSFTHATDTCMSIRTLALILGVVLRVELRWKSKIKIGRGLGEI